MPTNLNSSNLTIPIFIIFIILIGVGISLSYLGQTASAIATYTAAFFCLIFVFLPKFKWFKVWGLEGELREKINEAEEITVRLRSISVLVTEALFTLMARMGRLGAALSRGQAYDMMKRFEGELETNGVPSKEIAVAKKEWNRFMMFDLAYNPVLKKIHDKLNEKILAKSKEIDIYPQPIAAGDPVFKKLCDERGQMHQYLALVKNKWNLDHVQELTSGSVNALVNECPFFLQEEKSAMLLELGEEIEDLDYYARHQEFRRLEKWLEET